MDVYLWLLVSYLLYTTILRYFSAWWLSYRDDIKPVFADKHPCYKIYIKTNLYLSISWLIGIEGRVFTNRPGDLGSIPGHLLLKTLKKWYLIPPCLTLSSIRYVSRVKWSNPGKRVAPSTTPWCNNYWKGSLLVTLNYGHQLYFLLYDV